MKFARKTGPLFRENERWKGGEINFAIWRKCVLAKDDKFRGSFTAKDKKKVPELEKLAGGINFGKGAKVVKARSVA